ncbi:MAG: hypothetical protein Q9166_005152 [cf. Caloplaca sp. 2 TL-2023]
MAEWLSFTSHNNYDHPHTVLVGYAGNGLGLCTDYADAEACKDEEANIRGERIFTITYTNTSPQASVSSLVAAYLGYASQENQPDKAAYWTSVHTFLSKILSDAKSATPPIPNPFCSWSPAVDMMLPNDDGVEREGMQMVMGFR